MLIWASQFSICCFLDNCNYTSGYHSFECLLGVGSIKTFACAHTLSSDLSSFIESNNDWIFGHFNYETEMTTVKKTPSHNNETSFPDHFLFIPEIVISVHKNDLTIGTTSESADLIFLNITQQVFKPAFLSEIKFKNRISEQEYLNKVGNLKRHIQQGDCYEINFCQEFFATATIDPVSVFTQLISVSPNPFSAFYRVNENYLLCASPERYLKKEGNKILSQPIKGTAARNRYDATEDEKSKKTLSESVKEKSENVMIVDLVRNDLSKICKEASVVVEELFGIYTFPHVYQMISTIAGIIETGKTFSDILEATFPMGSMTGAPKTKVMELIKKYENKKRGIYSGTLGYFTPDKNFDFNVIIRSLVYNETCKYLSFRTGSAITAFSDPQKEYEECLLKGEAIRNIFSGNV